VTIQAGLSDVCAGHNLTHDHGLTQKNHGRGEQVTGDLSREHWIVPVHGLTRADPDGIVQAIARRDGTVSLHMTCGDTRTTGWLDVSRAAQLCTGIWEAAGASQQLTGYLGDDQPLPPHGSGDPPVAGRSHHHRDTPPQRSSPRLRRRLTPVNQAAAMDTDDTRMIGQRIRRIRHARDKSLQVIAGLAGMSRSTLHRVEHGQRELTLSEIVALANALEIAPSTLIRLPILAPANRPTDTARKTAQALIS
jgi:DNA-binding Xre family transcriptional regulator